MEDLKLNQDILRTTLLQEVKYYCGYADDVHDDYIIVNDSTFEVDYHSHLDNNRKEGYRYYSLYTLVKMKDLCFIPDEIGIEAVVQDIYPSPEVQDFIDRAIARISDFLTRFTPSNLRSCKLSVGVLFHNFGCFDESDPENITSFDPDSSDEEDLECYNFYPLRKFVVKGPSSYTIKSYPLARLAVESLSLL